MTDDGESRRKELIRHTFESKAEGFERCFWHTFDEGGIRWCPRPAIRAHSVQNRGVLDLLVDNGHVIAPTLRLNIEDGPQIELKRTGRNEATTFAGLCGRHDDELFGPVEKGAIDLGNPEHRFLLSYRATFYELHATATTAKQTQDGYLKRIALGIDPKGGPLSPAGAFATERMIVMHRTWAYKSAWDIAYVAHDFGAVKHRVIELDVAEPTVAASAMFAVGEDQDSHFICVCLTIVPVSQHRTCVLVSYLPKHTRRVRRALYALLKSSGDRQKLGVSRHLLNRCSNFVLSPRFVDSWTPDRRKRIVDLFIRTTFKHDFSESHADLNLFA